MYNNCNEVYNAINASPLKAKEILNAFNTCLKRNLVIVFDEKEQSIITGFSANKKNMRIIR